MMLLGRVGDENLCCGLICFVEEEVMETLEANRDYTANKWKEVKNFLTNRFKRYDNVVTRRLMNAQLEKREYTDLHDYLQIFESLAGKLVGAEVLSPTEKVSAFVRGLKDDDFDNLMPKLTNDMTNELNTNWSVVTGAVEAYVAQRDLIERHHGEMLPTSKQTGK